jgi:hypothetical protein
MGFPLVEWDLALSEGAQAWANKCNYQHSQAAFREDHYVTNSVKRLATTTVGETIVADAFATEGAQINMNAIFGQAESWDCHKNHCSADKDGNKGSCGSFLQAIDDDTTRMGCGYRLCEVNSPFGKESPDWNYLVCWYNPQLSAVERPFEEDKCDTFEAIDFVGVESDIAREESNSPKQPEKKPKKPVKKPKKPVKKSKPVDPARTVEFTAEDLELPDAKRPHEPKKSFGDDGVKVVDFEEEDLDLPAKPKKDLVDHVFDFVEDLIDPEDPEAPTKKTVKKSGKKPVKKPGKKSTKKSGKKGVKKPGKKTGKKPMKKPVKEVKPAFSVRIVEFKEKDLKLPSNTKRPHEPKKSFGPNGVKIVEFSEVDLKLPAQKKKDVIDHIFDFVDDVVEDVLPDDPKPVKKPVRKPVKPVRKPVKPIRKPTTIVSDDEGVMFA